jgi:hypothetical protein
MSETKTTLYRISYTDLDGQRHEMSELWPGLSAHDAIDRMIRAKPPEGETGDEWLAEPVEG